MVLGACLPRTRLRKGLARYRDDLPAALQKALDGCVADPPTCPRQEQCTRHCATRGRSESLARDIASEVSQALLMELGIGNRTTLFAHPRLAESTVCFEEPIVTFALDDVLPSSIRIGGHGYDRRQASRCESQAGRSLKNHDNYLRV